MNTHFNFTKPLLESLPFAETGGRVTYHDTHKNAVGLQLRITASAKTFFIQKRVNGTPERVTLGRFSDMTIEQARKQATDLSANIAKGINPTEKKRLDRAEMTFAEFW